MKLVKMAGIAALLALVGVAVVVITGIGSASADEEGPVDIVLCKEPGVTMCPPGRVWPGGKLTTATALGGLELLDLYNVVCNQSVLKGGIVWETGPPLRYNITESANSECSGEGCPTATVTYEKIPIEADIVVAAVDEYSVEMSLKITVVCGKNTCKYGTGAEKISFPIDEPIVGKPKVLLKGSALLYEEGSFCGKKLNLDATYEMVGGTLSIRLTLFQL